MFATKISSWSTVFFVTWIASCTAQGPPGDDASAFEHGQWVYAIEIVEHSPGLGTPADPLQATLNNCLYRRGNRYPENWISWSECYPHEDLMPPVIPYEKFPLQIFPDTIDKDSSDPAIRHIWKQRHLVALFYFESMDPILPPPIAPLPTDIFDMQFRPNMGIKFFRNITNRTKPPAAENKTTYDIQFRLDAPNILRGDEWGITTRYRIVLEVKHPVSGAVQVWTKGDVGRDRVRYFTQAIQIPTALLQGNAYECAASLQIQRDIPLLPGEPGFPGWRTNEWEYVDGTDFFKLKKKDGVN